MTHRLRLSVIALHAALVLAVAPLVAHAQAFPPGMGPEARTAIKAVIDSARAAGLPTQPLTDKVREGTLKGADETRIVTAVQALARELGAARTVLGSANNPALLSATASALHAGVSASELRRVVHPVNEESADPLLVTSALVTLVDIVSKKVPAGVAASAIGDLLQRGANEQQFSTLRSEVEQDILGGRTPESAMLDRTRAHLRQLDGIQLPARSGAPTRPPGGQDITGVPDFR